MNEDKLHRIRNSLDKKKILKLLQVNMEILATLHQPLEAPRTGEWLAVFKESGQTFQEYINLNEMFIDEKKHTIYIQPIGDLGIVQGEIISLAAKHLSLYYNLNVQLSTPLPLSIIPRSARRKDPFGNNYQLLTSYILNKVLLKRIPKDAIAYLAFTVEDLYAGENWNFVFGQASFKKRVGVWSIYRYGDPTQDTLAFRYTLLRTLKTSTHEIGHIFSMKHCTAYKCLMNGSNSLNELDLRPLQSCPECIGKICWLTKTNPLDCYQKLMPFYKNNGLFDEYKRVERSFKILSKSINNISFY